MGYETGVSWMNCAKEGRNCQCIGEVRYGYEIMYSSNWSDPVGSTNYVACANVSFGNHSLPADVGRRCQCRLLFNGAIPKSSGYAI